MLSFIWFMPPLESGSSVCMYVCVNSVKSLITCIIVINFLPVRIRNFFYFLRKIWEQITEAFGYSSHRPSHIWTHSKLLLCLANVKTVEHMTRCDSLMREKQVGSILRFGGEKKLTVQVLHKNVWKSSLLSSEQEKESPVLLKVNKQTKPISDIKRWLRGPKFSS